MLRQILLCQQSFVREFRVAFIELLLRRSYPEAQEFERALIGNNDVRPQDGQDGEGMEQIAEEGHVNNGTDRHEDQSCNTVIAFSANIN